ncbi:MAG TPA: hypothetical protein VE953_03555 [Terriglobales bacterium]|nr:hypothetical protein [Terriglobales bacterium]
MPLSDVARRAVEAVTARYPRDAQRLLDMMRTAPEAARRKPTRFGPLNVALMGNPPLPPEEARLVEAFALEWLAGGFDIHELADAVEAALNAQTGRPQDPRRHRPDAWRTLTGEPVRPGRIFQHSDN